MKRIRTARVAGVVAAMLLSSVPPRGAYADAPPTADATHLTPPEAAPAPIAAEPAVSSTPLEVLPGPEPTKLAAYIFGGVAVVGVGVGTAFGVLSLNGQSTFNAHPTQGNADSANQEAVVADVAFGAAVIAGVTSVVLFLKKDPPSDVPASSPPATTAPKTDSVSLTVAPVFSSHGGGAGALLRF